MKSIVVPESNDLKIRRALVLILTAILSVIAGWQASPLGVIDACAPCAQCNADSVPLPQPVTVTQ